MCYRLPPSGRFEISRLPAAAREKTTPGTGRERCLAWLTFFPTSLCLCPPCLTSFTASTSPAGLRPTHPSTARSSLLRSGMLTRRATAELASSLTTCSWRRVSRSRRCVRASLPATPSVSGEDRNPSAVLFNACLSGLLYSNAHVRHSGKTVGTSTLKCGCYACTFCVFTQFGVIRLGIAPADLSLGNTLLDCRIAPDWPC